MKHQLHSPLQYLLFLLNQSLSLLQSRPPVLMAIDGYCSPSRRSLSLSLLYKSRTWSPDLPLFFSLSLLSIFAHAPLSFRFRAIANHLELLVAGEHLRELPSSSLVARAAHMRTPHPGAFSFPARPNCKLHLSSSRRSRRPWSPSLLLPRCRFLLLELHVGGWETSALLFCATRIISCCSVLAVVPRIRHRPPCQMWCPDRRINHVPNHPIEFIVSLASCRFLQRSKSCLRTHFWVFGEVATQCLRAPPIPVACTCPPAAAAAV
jgi:hypothetical protein